MNKPMSFEKFKATHIETFEEFKTTQRQIFKILSIEQDLSESDAGLAQLQEYYTQHCQMRYNQYLIDLSGHNPTHAFDFDPNEES